MPRPFRRVRTLLASREALIVVSSLLPQELENIDWDSFPTSSSRKLRKRDRVKAWFTRTSPSAASKGTASPSGSAELDESSSTTTVNVVPLSFVKNMAEWMVAADVLVTKAGPGTIAEAAALNLPIMLTSFLPGQEAGNVDVVLSAGFGVFCKTPSKVSSSVVSWLKDPKLLETMSKNSERIAAPKAAEHISQIILDKAISNRKQKQGSQSPSQQRGEAAT